MDEGGQPRRRDNDPFAERIGGIPWVVIAAAAALTAVVYAILPAGGESEGARWIILRWSHTVAWVFFSAAALARARIANTPLEWAAPLAATGGLVYLVFMVTSTSGP